MTQNFDGQLPLLVHVGAMATRDSIELAKHAKRLKGVKGISALPPVYYSMPAEDQANHLRRISEVGELPFYPYLRQEMLREGNVEALIEMLTTVSYIAGVKAHIRDLSIHQLLLHYWPDEWQLFHAFDETLFQARTF